MKRFDRYLAEAAAALALLAGCTQADDSLGSNLVPENQQMKTGYVSLPRRNAAGEYVRRTLVRTRPMQTDSIVSSKIGYGYMGSELNDTLGLRTAGFLTQYLDYIENFEAGMFGYRPFVDSVQLMMTIDQYGRDTLTPQLYEIYEVVNDDFLADKEDTTFYLNFRADEYIDSEPLFTFTFPTEQTTDLASATVTLDIKTKGEHLLKRLLLQEGKYKDDYSIYTSADSIVQWMEEFKGIYIRPAKGQEQSEMGKGGIYGLDLSQSALAVYARNRRKEDPSLVQDTLRLYYLFSDSEAPNFGNVSINTLERDYDRGSMQLEKFRESAAGESPESDPRMVVEGMGGMVTEITFTPEFFAELEAEIEQGNANGEGYTTLAFSQARMLVYFADSGYAPESAMTKNPAKLIAEMDAATERIGLYTDYKNLTPVTDYNYSYEKTYSTELPYDGRINRSRGCYTMDITGYMQTLWNSYAAERDAAKAENRAVEMDNVKNRTIYAAPEAYGLYTPSFCVLQGMDDAHNDAPIRFEILSNLVK